MAQAFVRALLGRSDYAIIGEIVELLGGPYFAVIHGGCLPRMAFDGDGIYTIPVGRVRPGRD